jgi:hypothetical protein
VPRKTPRRGCKKRVYAKCNHPWRRSVLARSPRLEPLVDIGYDHDGEGELIRQIERGELLSLVDIIKD